MPGPADDDRFDGMYMNLAQQNQGIDNLLDSFFGFLRRKTDFFTGVSEAKLEESLLKVCVYSPDFCRRTMLSVCAASASKQGPSQPQRQCEGREESNHSATNVRCCVAAVLYSSLHCTIHIMCSWHYGHTAHRLSPGNLVDLQMGFDLSWIHRVFLCAGRTQRHRTVGC